MYCWITYFTPINKLKSNLHKESLKLNSTGFSGCANFYCRGFKTNIFCKNIIYVNFFFFFRVKGFIWTPWLQCSTAPASIPPRSKILLISFFSFFLFFFFGHPHCDKDDNFLRKAFVIYSKKAHLQIGLIYLFIKNK